MRQPVIDRRTSLKVLLGVPASLALAGLVACSDDRDGQDGQDSQQDATSTSTADITSVDPDDPYGTGIHHVAIEVEGYGTIEATLNANVAPITVANFCRLANEGFYDGLTFHRVISGFMIQGGDPEGNGTGGSDQTILGEFSSNGVENSIPHVRGTISMARSSDNNSASSQFFIMHDTSSSLDGDYAAFGTVTSGMDVVDAICENTPVEDSNGTVAAENQPVITKVEVID